MERRLAAILAADVVGYSRLMGQDEAGTVEALKTLRAQVIDPKIAEHKGRIFKSTGDGVLAEFPSVVNAVSCAVGVQRSLAVHNADLPADRAITLRIGVNLGDVIIEGDDILGDGVNVAARLESIALPGSVTVSGTVRDHLGNRLDLDFEDLGAQTLKNIDKPVKVYQVTSHEPRSAASASPMEVFRAKPSVAILPFVNMSSDHEQQYFSDGITEDLITELSRFQSLLVIARNSSFQYRDKSVDVRRVARELGVHYVVEGSVRRSGERLRITAQLVDARTGDHVWADRYDRDMHDVFAVQDEMARTIASTLAGRVLASAAELAKQKPTRDWKAYDYLLQGRERDYQYDVIGAEAFYARAAELDPGYCHAHAYRAIALAVIDWNNRDQENLRRAEATAQLALSLDAYDAPSNQAAGYVALVQGKFEQAGIYFERALSLNPNDVLIVADHANWLIRTGRPAEALERLDAAMKRDPYPAAWIWEIRYLALFHLRRYSEAIAALSSVSRFYEGKDIYLIAAQALSGHLDQARANAKDLLVRRPDTSITLVARAEPYSSQQLLDPLLDGLRKAGLPE